MNKEVEISPNIQQPTSKNNSINGDKNSLELVQSTTDTKKRDEWSNHLEFILSTIGYSVGFGNVWRFPYVVYSNGGGAYLIPYVLMLVLVGKPIYLLEMALGQLTQLGPSGAFRICPIAAGVGAAMTGISFFISVFYNVLMAYTLFFTYASFQSTLPWTHCNNTFNTKNCFTLNAFNGSNSTQFVANTSSSFQEYWDFGVLGKSDHLYGIKNIKWDLCIFLFISWAITYACLCKGIKSAGKVIYLTVSLPYVLLFILMVRGVTLQGASKGLLYLFKPQWERLTHIKVWQEACSQMFFSLSVTLGGVIAFSSFNSFHNNCYRDTLIISIMDTVTSLLSGIVIFSVLGFMSYTTSIPMDQVASKSGAGLVFVVYPQALASLPFPQLWTILFFLTLYSLGLDSIVAAIEVVLCGLHDTFPKLFPWKHKSYVCLGMCILFFLLGLTLVTEGGFYLLEIINSYVADFSLVFIGGFEVIAIIWLYGYKNFVSDIEIMIGKKLSNQFYWKVSWIVICPLVLFSIGIFSVYQMSQGNIIKNGDRHFPLWSHVFGGILTLITAGFIPILAIYKFVLSPGTTCYQKWKNAVEPEENYAMINNKFAQLPSVSSFKKTISVDVDSGENTLQNYITDSKV